MIYSIFKKYAKTTLTALTLVTAVSCYDSGYEEFEAPTGNVNNIQPSTIFTTSTDADNSLKIVFRSFSTDADSYTWDFGDGVGTSTEANTEYAYTTGGLYNVKLTTVSSDGLVAIDSANVAPIFIDFNTTSVDTEVTFENLTTGAKSLTWDFGDGETATWNSEGEDTGNFSTSHTYTTADVFEATLTAVSFAEEVVEVSLTKKIEGLVLSTIPDFSFNVSTLEVSFTDESLYAESYSWDFGDGTTSTEQNPTHTYTEEGGFDVVLTTTNIEGVSRSITKTVPVGAVKATKAAVIINGTIDDFQVEDGRNKDDNNDAWELDPPNQFKDGSDSPYTWDNASLETSASTKLKAAGITTSENSGVYALKFDAPERRAYQPFEVETGVTYTISMYVRTESADDFNVYILNNEVADETALAANSDAVFTVSDGTNKYINYTFTFEATSNTAVFYAVPFSGVSGTTEVYLDDIEISTPGFEN